MLKYAILNKSFSYFCKKLIQYKKLWALLLRNVYKHVDCSYCIWVTTKRNTVFSFFFLNNCNFNECYGWKQYVSFICYMPFTCKAIIDIVLSTTQMKAGAEFCWQILISLKTIIWNIIRKCMISAFLRNILNPHGETWVTFFWRSKRFWLYYLLFYTKILVLYFSSHQRIWMV